MILGPQGRCSPRKRAKPPPRSPNLDREFGCRRWPRCGRHSAAAEPCSRMGLQVQTQVQTRPYLAQIGPESPPESAQCLPVLGYVQPSSANMGPGSTLGRARPHSTKVFGGNRPALAPKRLWPRLARIFDRHSPNFNRLWSEHGQARQKMDRMRPTLARVRPMLV